MREVNSEPSVWGSTFSSLDLLFSPSLGPHWNPALLGQLQKLSTLILDGNHYTSHIKFPYMPSVTTLYINKNRLNNLPVFVEEIRRKFPNIKSEALCDLRESMR